MPKTHVSRTMLPPPFRGESLFALPASGGSRLSLACGCVTSNLSPFQRLPSLCVCMSLCPYVVPWSLLSLLTKTVVIME